MKYSTGDERQLLRMKQLVEATGERKSTILHYVNEGLLPEPLKTANNMAYYDPSCVERVKFIKRMQGQYRLPLGKIRKLLSLRDNGQDVTLRTELLQTIFGETERAPLDKGQFCEATGLTPGQVDQLLEAKLLLPLRKGAFDEEDMGMGIIYARGFSRGMVAEDWAFYPRAAKEIVDNEMRLRRRMTSHLPEEEDAEATIQLVHAARATRSYVIDRIFQHRVAAAQDLKDEEMLS